MYFSIWVIIPLNLAIEMCFTHKLTLLLISTNFGFSIPPVLNFTGQITKPSISARSFLFVSGRPRYVLALNFNNLLNIHDNQVYSWKRCIQLLSLSIGFTYYFIIDLKNGISLTKTTKIARQGEIALIKLAENLSYSFRTNSPLIVVQGFSWHLLILLIKIWFWFFFNNYEEYCIY